MQELKKNDQHSRDKEVGKSLKGKSTPNTLYSQHKQVK